MSLSLIRYTWICVTTAILVTTVRANENGTDLGARTKRSLVNFGDMIECMTGRSALQDVNGYGCWCGKGGGGTPLDETDRCCYVHDNCYGRVIDRDDCTGFATFTPSQSPYWGSYDYTCSRGNIICHEDVGSCMYDSCMCDREMAYCMNRHPYVDSHSPRHVDRDSQCVEPENSEYAFDSLRWTLWCIQHGTVNAITATQGAPASVARQYGLSTSGVHASQLMVDIDAVQLNLYKHLLKKVAFDFGLEPALLGAVASRLSMGGRELSTDGFNNRLPFLYGLMGCNTQRYNDCEENGPLSYEHIYHTVRRQLLLPLQEALNGTDNSTHSTYLRDAIGEYLAMPIPRSLPTGHSLAVDQLSSDVIVRAQRLSSYHQWNCREDQRAVAAPPNLELVNCAELALNEDCTFYDVCIERKRQCGESGFAMGIGKPFCLEWAEQYNSFDGDAKEWISDMKVCTMNAIRAFINRPGIDCATLSEMAKDAETTCMLKKGSWWPQAAPGFCHILSSSRESLKSVYRAVIQGLSGNSRTIHENAIWEQAKDLLVSCKAWCYGLSSSSTGLEQIFACNILYSDVWEDWKSVASIEIQERRKRSVSECRENAAGDCAFWECLDRELACSTRQGSSLAMDFKRPFCFKIASIQDTQVKAILGGMERCVMNRIMDNYLNAQDSCMDLELAILAAQTECLVEGGICGIGAPEEWTLERLTSIKGFPANGPREYGKVSASGGVELLTSRYYRALRFFKQQLGHANRLCYQSGQATSPDLYEMRFSPEAGTDVKYRVAHGEL